jgi:2-polyprenyl-6-hydroxyphenyl methylase/3-demethylubiquinone-9 3-methyltransferase
LKFLSQFRFRLPEALQDTRSLAENARYDALSTLIPDFIFSPDNPLIWQNQLRYPYFRAWFGDVRGRKIADLGCGWGFLARKFALDGAGVVGLDLSREAMKLGRMRQPVPDGNLLHLQCRLEALPLRTGFDFVTCTDVLEHVEDLPRVIEEAARLLKPKGRFGFVTVNQTRWARIIYIDIAENLAGLLPKGTHRFEKFVPPSELARLFALCGLRLLDLRGILVNPFLRRYHFWRSKAIEYIGVAEKE